MGGVCLPLAHPERVPAGSTLCRRRHLRLGAAPDRPPPRSPPELPHPFWSPGPPARGPPYPRGRDGTAPVLCCHGDHTQAGPGSGSYPGRTRPASGWRLSPSSWLSLCPQDRKVLCGRSAPGVRGGGDDAPGLVPARDPRSPAPPGFPRVGAVELSGRGCPGAPALAEARAGLSCPRPAPTAAGIAAQSQSFLPGTLHFLRAKWKVERHIYIPAKLPVVPLFL